MPVIRISQKLVYFAHVPRCAGTAVEAYLRQRFGPLAFLDPRHLEVPPEDRWTRTSPQHVDRGTLGRLFPPGFFDHSFAVVRHPSDRLLSVYRFQKYIENRIPQGQGFAEWLATLPVPIDAFDNHTRPMSDLVPEDAVVFRLEDGLDAVVHWLDGLAGNSDPPRRIEQRNGVDQRLQHLKQPVAEVPDRPEMATILQLFEADFDRFGYERSSQRETTRHAADFNALKLLEPKREEKEYCLSARNLILHYHVFKNAGTSVDEILQRNFPDQWTTREFPGQDEDNSGLVTDWIREDIGSIAFSSHTATGPFLAIPDTRVISLIFLRDPLERIRSVYQFERNEPEDTFWTKLAKEHDLEGYVRARLAIPGDRQCRNIHTRRLSTFVPCPEPELERAIKALSLISIVGCVENFTASMARFAELVRPIWPGFKNENLHANKSPPDAKVEMSDVLRRLLEEANGDDIALYMLRPG